MAHPSNMPVEYDLKSVNLPYLSGIRLRLFAIWLESPLRGLIVTKLFRDSGITWFRKQSIDDPPTLYPLAFTHPPTSETARVPEDEWPGPSANSTPHLSSVNSVADRGAWGYSPKTPFSLSLPSRQELSHSFATIHDYAAAYRNGQIFPVDVAQRLLKAIQASDATGPPLNTMIAVDRDNLLKQAEAATKRIKDGHALSVFDGVPVAVKDELNMVPYRTTVGTRFLGVMPAREDATVVARLRAAGALLIGKTNMHEIGLGITGLNPHHGAARNPYNPNHYSGGSSSGSAVAVAAGFCPLAIGADGGGSIRIPASFCGLVGLKATFGRISEFGAFPLAWSVAHVGILTATATDAVQAYGVIAGPDSKDPLSLQQPQPSLQGWDNLDLSDLTLGVYWPWFRHATPDTVTICEILLENFEMMGGRVQEIAIPQLEMGRLAHVVTISTEMAQALDRYNARHRRDYGLDVRINLALAREFTGRDYIQAQRVRTRLMANFNQVLNQVDVIITPTSGLPAPIIPQTALPHGDSDLTTLTEIMRFATPANFTGLPAISFPAGYNEAGIPIGMQAVGRAWQEQTLLRLALAAEQVVKRQQPQIYFKILD